MLTPTSNPPEPRLLGWTPRANGPYCLLPCFRMGTTGSVCRNATRQMSSPVGHHARIVPLAEIQRDDWSLNISRYVDISREVARISEAVRKLRQLGQARTGAEAAMNCYLAELAHGV